MPLARLAAPILALLATAAAPAEQRIEVALSNFKFTPATIQLVHSQPYVLHLSSRGGHSTASRPGLSSPPRRSRPRTARG